MTALVIIPTYNERENIPPLVTHLLAHRDVRVLVVDDQSPDGTGEAADALAREHPSRVEVLHPRRWSEARCWGGEIGTISETRLRPLVCGRHQARDRAGRRSGLPDGR